MNASGLWAMRVEFARELFSLRDASCTSKVTAAATMQFHAVNRVFASNSASIEVTKLRVCCLHDSAGRKGYKQECYKCEKASVLKPL